MLPRHLDANLTLPVGKICRGNRLYKPNPRLARVLDILFILHAEHEMNCSTAAARHLASRYMNFLSALREYTYALGQKSDSLLCSGVDVYTALAGAVGALYGPLHGGANEVYCHFFF